METGSERVKKLEDREREKERLMGGERVRWERGSERKEERGERERERDGLGVGERGRKEQRYREIGVKRERSERG